MSGVNPTVGMSDYLAKLLGVVELERGIHFRNVIVRTETGFYSWQVMKVPEPKGRAIHYPGADYRLDGQPSRRV